MRYDLLLQKHYNIKLKSQQELYYTWMRFYFCIADRGPQHHQPDWQNLRGTQAMVEIQRATGAGILVFGQKVPRTISSW